MIPPCLTVVFCALAAGFAAGVHGAVGIGFPMVATPLLAMVMDVKTAVLVLVLPTVLINTINILKGGNWKNSIAPYWPLALYGIAGSFLGTQALVTAPAEFFRPLLACILILYLNAERLGVGFSWIPAHPKMATAFFGTAAGLLGGTVNVMLPALVIFALEIKMDKTAMIQVFNLCFLTGKLTQAAVLLTTGHFTAKILQTSLVLALVCPLIMILAMGFRNRIRGKTHRKWLRRLLALMSGVLLIQTLMG